MTDNVSRDMCEVHGVELPTDAFYETGGRDFRNDCGEAITACITDLNANQLCVISAAEEILDAALVDLVYAETDEAFDAIQRTTELGEPEVFRSYQAKWNVADEVIVHLVMEAQAANGIEPNTANDYEKLPCAK
jgi:hypothetical protein